MAKSIEKDDDSTHLPMFHQVEGIYVDKDVSFAKFKRYDIQNNKFIIWR